MSKEYIDCHHGYIKGHCPIYLYRLEAERDALKARVKELEKVLTDLLVWATWIKARRKEVHMNEPATGAIFAAEDALKRGVP